MKIVVNAFAARLGGGRTYLTNLLSNLPDDPSLDIRLFAPPDLPFKPDSRISRMQTAWPVANPIARAAWERIVLRPYLKQNSINVLFCPGGLVSINPPPGCRSATMFRNMLPFDRKALKRLPWGLQKLRNLILRHLMLRSMRKADLTIFISDYAREFIQARTAVPNSETIPHGIPEQFLTHDQEIERPAETAGGDYILYVSRFEAYKHHREVIEAYGMLPANLQREVKLLLVGENDYAEGSQAIEFVAAKGLTDRVIFTGKISYDRLPAFYRNARAIVFASSCENCPNIMLEAMGSGRPLLASNVMPMPEFGGLDIAYFSPYEPETLRPQLQQVLTDQAYAAKLALASKERSQRYNWAVTAESTWRALYNLAQTVEIRHDI